MNHWTRRTFIGAALAALLAPALPAFAADPIKIGLVTALSGQSARAGEAITRGLTIAIDEINAKGGVLGGRKLELVRARRRSESRQGRDRRARAASSRRRSRCSSAASTRRCRWRSCRSSTRRRCRSWARGPPARRSRKNGANPNYVFRVSAVDEIVDKAMLQYAQKTFRREEARHDPRQQSLGRVEREGPQGRAAARRA